MKNIIVTLLISLALQSVVLAAELPITSEFGWRNDPITGEWKFHAGVDLGYEYNTCIPALFSGVVVSAGYEEGYGNCVLLYHSDLDAYTRYGHCASVSVSIWQAVSAGDIIAYVGSTGRSTGPHLHLEYILKTDSGYQYVNPLLLWQ